MNGHRGGRRSWAPPVIHAAASAHVRAPAERVRALYEEFEAWSRLFPATVRGTRLVRRQGETTFVEVDHVEGKVLNVLHRVTPTRIDLEEFKRRFEAVFTNEFVPDGDGMRFTVAAAVRPKWPYWVFAPFLKPLVRSRLRRYVVEPVKAAAEASGTPG